MFLCSWLYKGVFERRVIPAPGKAKQYDQFVKMNQNCVVCNVEIGIKCGGDRRPGSVKMATLKTKHLVDSHTL